MSKKEFIIRVELDGYREYKVEAKDKVEAEEVYFDNILDSNKVKLVAEGFSDEEGFVSEITEKNKHIHYRNK